MRDVDVGMRAVIGRGHDLAVLPDTEDQRHTNINPAASRVILVSMPKCGFRVAD